MPSPEFCPGFRLSFLDVVVLVIGGFLTFVAWPVIWWAGFVIAFVVGHFFLFCNVFRISRDLELAWGAIFLVVTMLTITTGNPGWPQAIGISLAATVIAVAIEMRKPSYHGIFWKRVNPGLTEWWDKRHQPAT